MNEELLAQGLGTIDDTMHGFQSKEDYVDFARGLMKVEQVAKRKGLGVWEGGEYESWWRKTRRTLRWLTRRQGKDDSD